MSLISVNRSRTARVLLFVVLLAGVSLLSAAPQAYYKLSTNGPLPIGGDVGDFLISADGQTTVYRAGQEVDNRRDLYAVPTDGSGDPVRLSALPDSGRNVDFFAISPDNAHAVYLADQDTNGLVELYSVCLLYTSRCV